MLSGAGDLEADALRSGIDQFVSKPCTADALAHAVVVALSAGAMRRDRREHERHNEGEMMAAAAIQAALLPPDPELPEGWTVDTGFLPSRVVGGDVYDLFPHGPATLVVTVADVSGKGVAGALFGAMFLTAVRAAVSRGDAPGAALASAGALLFGDLVRAGRFLTATVAEIDLDSGAVIYADAGHGHHLLLASNGAERALPEGGPPIGFLPDPGYDDGTDRIRPGESLAIFSDGLVEGGDRDDPVAVRGTLAQLLIAGEPAEALVRDAPDDDDRTMVVVRRAT
jgi:serine phosphatase RsbU (regulator of sigma subunit)